MIAKINNIWVYIAMSVRREIKTNINAQNAINMFIWNVMIQH